MTATMWLAVLGAPIFARTSFAIIMPVCWYEARLGRGSTETGWLGASSAPVTSIYGPL